MTSLHPSLPRIVTFTAQLKEDPMNTTFSGVRRASLLLALALALTLVIQAAPAYAGLGTSPTITLSASTISWCLTSPISLIAGLGTSPSIDVNGNFVPGVPIADAPLELYIDDILVGTGITDADGQFELSYDPSGLLPGEYTVDLLFPGGDIKGESYDEGHARALLVVEGFYGFPGFQPPVTMGALNTVKAGQTVPIKWPITDENGNAVGDLRWIKSLKSDVLPTCEGSTVNPIAEADTSGSSGLRYDTDANQYIFTFQTEKAWAGTCRRLVLTLINNDSYSVDFQFK